MAAALLHLSFSFIFKLRPRVLTDFFPPWHGHASRAARTLSSAGSIAALLSRSSLHVRHAVDDNRWAQISFSQSPHERPENNN